MESISDTQDQIRRTLRELGFAPHHTGYKLLVSAIQLYVQNNTVSATKELYPSLSKQSRLYSASSIERSIRYAISEAWAHGSRRAWNKYFPLQEKVPSNMAFIAAISDMWM